jgi:GMP synthase (glutamine-hydrolysing)
MIIIIDFGSQTTHLISRRIRDFGIRVKIIVPEEFENLLNNTAEFNQINGFILSGGPSSVYETNAPTINPKIFTLNIPILGICYGQQLTAYLLGGKVNPGNIKEYGPSQLQINSESKLFTHITDSHFNVWMSHGDEVVNPPQGFNFVASTPNIHGAVMQNEDQKSTAFNFILKLSIPGMER